MSQTEQTTQNATNAPDEQASAASHATARSGAASLLMDVKLPIRILLGRTQLCLKDLAQLGSGAVVELDCSPDAPVEIIVNDRVIAYGEVVVVAGNYGVRITKMEGGRPGLEVEGPGDDLRTLSEQLR